MKHTTIYEESHLKVLRLLEKNPSMSQRELAEELGVSLGKTNYCIQALVEKGLLKINNFRSNKNKSVYVYLLTPAGVSKRAELTIKFLKKKIQEYEILKEEIEQLEFEISGEANLK